MKVTKENTGDLTAVLRIDISEEDGVSAETLETLSQQK